VALLAGFTHYVDFAISADDIASDVTGVLLPIRLSASAGLGSADLSAIFDELGDDPYRMAVTIAGETDQFHVGILHWDPDNHHALLEARKSDETFSSSGGVTCRLYYDKHAIPNPQYVHRYDLSEVLPAWVKAFASGEAGQSTTTVNLSDLWLIRPRAVSYNGYTYVVGMDYSDTEIQAVKINETTGVISGPVKVADALIGDMHGGPSIALDADHKILVFFGSYNGAANKLVVYKSTSEEDISAWGSEVTVASGDGYYTYAIPHVYADGTLDCFYRCSISPRVWKRKRSTDNGATWGNEFTFLSDSAYVAMYLDGDDRLHIVWHEGDDGDVHYVYTDNPTAATPTFKEIDGDTASTPIAPSHAGSLAFNDTGWAKCYIGGVVADQQQNPVLFAKLADDGATNKLIAIYRSGDSWTTADVLESNNIEKVGTERTVYADCAMDGLYVHVAVCVQVASYSVVREFRAERESLDSWEQFGGDLSYPSEHVVYPTYPVDHSAAIRLIAYKTASAVVYNQDKDLCWSGLLSGYALALPWSSTIVLRDLSGNGHDMTRSGCTETTVGDGAAHDYDGTDKAQNTSPSLSIGSDLWVEVLGRFDDDPPSGNQWFVSMWEASGDDRSWGLFVRNTRKIDFATSYNGANVASATEQTAVTAGDLFHAIGLHDDTNSLLLTFLNGAKEGEGGTAYGIHDDPTIDLVFGDTDGGDGPLDGLISMVLIGNAIPSPRDTWGEIRGKGHADDLLTWGSIVDTAEPGDGEGTAVAVILE